MSQFPIAGRSPEGSGPVYELRMSLSERAGRHVAQSELAKKSGVSRSAIQGHERAGTRPSRSIWKALESATI